jgi:isopenicillin N synthase-like dioxygenase
VLTLLLAEPGSEGLQVRGRDGGWVDVPALDGAFIVNIGELLEFATSGYLRATEHRVNLRQSSDRISVPYFFNPRLEAQVPTLALPADLAQLAGRRADPSDPIFSVYGRNAWKSRLRAHPDVAAAHGYVTTSGEGVTPGR